MVKIKIIELPIQFSKTLPTIAIHFGGGDDAHIHYGKAVDIVLRNQHNNPLNTWTYTHRLQATDIIHLTGINYGIYSLELKPTTSSIEIPYTIMCQNQTLEYPEINHSDKPLLRVADPSLLVNDGSRSGFAGALLTSGSFTMMASNSY